MRERFTSEIKTRVKPSVAKALAKIAKRREVSVSLVAREALNLKAGEEGGYEKATP